MNELRGIVGNPEAGLPSEAGEPAPTLSLWTTMEHQYSAAPHWSHTPSSLSSGINLSFHQKIDLSMMADQQNWCSNHGCSYFPVTVFVSWFWQVINSSNISDSQFQAFFLVLLPGTFAVGQKFHLSSGLILGVDSFGLVLMGLLPARMLRQGVTKGQPARFDDHSLPINRSISRILVWVISIGSQAIMCVLFVLLPGSGVAWRGCVRGMTCGRGRNQYDPEIFFPCLAFTLATVVSLVSWHTLWIIQAKIFYDFQSCPLFK